jgi:hypothetical protein
MARSTTINAKACCEAPRRLPEVVSRKRSGSTTRGVAPQHDDPTVHSAQCTGDTGVAAGSSQGASGLSLFFFGGGAFRLRTGICLAL